MTERVAYFDHGSTAPLRQSALKAMKPYFNEKYGNASSVYSLGREARSAVDNARDTISGALGAQSDEIIFTSGGTESMILSLVGAYAGNRHRGKHIITTAFEHHATHAIFDFLESAMGAEKEIVGIDSDGMVRLDELEEKIRDDTVLVSVMRVNNEIGTIQDLERVVDICSPKGIIVHSDFVQAIGKTPVDFAKTGIDLACAAGHKFGGPKGTGFLYIRKGTYLESICAGSHEYGVRSGTENVPGIVGLAVAVAEAVKELPKLGKRLKGYKERLWECISGTERDAGTNGDQSRCVPAVLNVRLPGVDSESLVLALDREGVAASVGSACQTGSVEPSHVLTAIGLNRIDALSSFRLSMGYSTTDEDVARFAEVFPAVYDRVKSTVTT